MLPDKQDEAAFNDVYIVKGDPANEVILRRAKVAQAHSVVILADDRQGEHADGKTIVCCIAIKSVCTQERQPNIVAECQDPKYRPHMRKSGADEIISAADFGLRLMARASLFHGMTRVYQELLSVGRDANEMYLVPVPGTLVGMDFVAAANVFLPDRTNMKACLLIGLYRGDTMMLNPVGGEAGPLLRRRPADPAEPEPAGSFAIAGAGYRLAHWPQNLLQFARQVLFEESDAVVVDEADAGREHRTAGPSARCPRDGRRPLPHA